jgi:hypothetical protein
MNTPSNPDRKPGPYLRKLLPVALAAACMSVYSISTWHQGSLNGVASDTTTQDFDSMMHSFDRDLNRETATRAVPVKREAEPVGVLIRKMLLNQHYRHQPLGSTD